MKGPYDKIPFFRFDEAAAAEFLAWRRGLEVRLRSDSLSPALEGHLAKYRKLVPALALIDHLAEGGNGGVGKEAPRGISPRTRRGSSGISLRGSLVCDDRR